jgi:hypothetical protein
VGDDFADFAAGEFAGGGEGGDGTVDGGDDAEVDAGDRAANAGAKGIFDFGF